MKITTFNPMICTTHELSSDASSVGTSLISPSGFTITLGQHIRK